MSVHLASLSPGDHIKLALEDRGWTQADLAIITGLSRQSINYIITGKTAISPELAATLASAFDNDAQYWIKLENDFRLATIIDTNRLHLSAIEQRSSIMQIAPVRDMQKRGWIKSTDDFVELSHELKRFFGVDNLNSALEMPAAFRKSTKVFSDDKALRAWLYRAVQLAKTVSAEKFKASKLDKAQQELRRVAAFAKETYRVPQVLAKYGIRFLLIEQLPHTKIDGAAFWLDPERPVIVMSARFDRIDSFWFTLMHEFEHVKNQDSLSIDNDLNINAPADGVEKRANEGAVESLITPDELQNFIRRVTPLYSRQNIIQFAHRIKIHPGIIVGQLHHKGEIAFSTHRQLLVKVRGSALETALADGWGRVASDGMGA